MSAAPVGTPRPRIRLSWPATTAVSALAALTTWVTLLAWTPFAERPSGYMAPLFAVCLGVAATGALLRAARLPAVVVLLLQILLVGLWLHQRWAGQDAYAGWVPTSESLRELGATLRASAEAAQDYAAPVPRSVTEFPPLMVIAGAGTALLVDFIAAGLRHAPVAGLPLLAVYTAPVSILDGGVSWPKFALAGLCFLFLLAAQEAGRLANWGHQISATAGGSRLFDSQSTRVSNRAVWSSARKIGLTATGIAVVVPILVPTFAIGLFNGPGRGPGGGGSSVALSNPIVNMQRDLARGEDIDLVRVTTPDQDPTYLRISVLDAFDGDTWRPSGRDIPVEQRAVGLLPRPPGLDEAVSRETEPWRIDIADDFESSWLPAPYPVFSIDAPGDWRYDQETLDFISAVEDRTTAGISYELEAIKVDPTAEDLADAGPAPASISRPGTELPEDMPESVVQRAETVTQNAGSSFARAVALQQWFRTDGGFAYSLERAPGNGLDELENFLSEEGRVGYCEQFAAAMALMGRALNIPSRVAVGFLEPEDIADDIYVFSAHDLHAWPEMYFEGVGWVRFEPTPSVRTGAAPAYTRTDVSGGAPEEPRSREPVPQGPNRFESLGPQPTAGGGGGAGGFDTGRMLGTAGGVLALVALAVAPRLTRTLLRGRRWAAATTTPGLLAEAAWAELRATAEDLRLPWNNEVTVRTRARDLVRSFGRPGGDDADLSRTASRGVRANPAAAEALERLVRRVELARYSRAIPASAAIRAEVERDLETCVAALHAGAGRKGRARAAWLPASLWVPWGVARRPERKSGRIGFDEPGVDHAV